MQGALLNQHLSDTKKWLRVQEETPWIESRVLDLARHYIRLMLIKFFIGPRHRHPLVIAYIGHFVRPAGYRIPHLSLIA
jgi:hypothetical protein